jgi:hypothetical protein
MVIGRKYGENKNVVVASLLRTREQGRKKETKGREKIKKMLCVPRFVTTTSQLISSGLDAVGNGP